jgi:hypothetical protein
MSGDVTRVGGLTAAEEVRRRLQANLARRGYLLPHQGLMAVAMPDLQDGYMVMYTCCRTRASWRLPCRTCRTATW